MFSQACVKNSIQGGACMVGACVAGGVWQGACVACTPHPPPTIPRDAVNEWAVHILLECILVLALLLVNLLKITCSF